jgi:hypothetical protein
MMRSNWHPHVHALTRKQPRLAHKNNTFHVPNKTDWSTMLAKPSHLVAVQPVQPDQPDVDTYVMPSRLIGLYPQFNQYWYFCGDMTFAPHESSMGRAVYNMYQAAKRCRTGRLCDEVLYRLWQVAWFTFQCNLSSTSRRYKHKRMMQCIKKYKKSDQRSHVDLVDQRLVSQCVDQALGAGHVLQRTHTVF